jgi:hypothetical protein
MSRINFLKIQPFSLEIPQKHIRDSGESDCVRTKILDRSVSSLNLERCRLTSLSSQNAEGMDYFAFQNSVKKDIGWLFVRSVLNKTVASYSLYSDYFQGKTEDERLLHFSDTAPASAL